MQTVIEKKQKWKILNLFKGKNLKVLIKYLLLILFIEGSFGLVLIINKDLGIKNIFLSGSLIYIIQILSYIVCLNVPLKIGHKTIIILTTSIAIFCSGILLILDIISNIFLPYNERSQGIRITETGNFN